jgi:hypothetical protein
VTVSNVTVTRAQGVFQINQCTHFRNGGQEGDCGTSRFQVRDISISKVSGAITKDSVGSLKCSPLAPCTGISIADIDVKKGSGGAVEKYSCANVINPRGFKCR